MDFEVAAILFDLDGVLANSNATVEGAWRRWAFEKGLDAEQIVSWSHGRRTTDTLARLLPVEAHAAEVARLITLEREGIDLLVDVPGAREFVESLEREVWAVATSGEREIATARLRKAGISIPRVLVTAEDVQRGKPDPEVYLTAARELGVDPGRCVVFEDSPAGIEAGHCAGARVIALLTTFRLHDLSRADAHIDDFRSIRAEHTKRGVRIFVKDNVD